MQKVLLFLAPAALALPATLAYAQDMAPPAPAQEPTDMQQQRSMRQDQPTPRSANAPQPSSQPGAEAMAKDRDPNAGMVPPPVSDYPYMRPAPDGAPNNPAAPVGSARNPYKMGGNMTEPPPPKDFYPVCGGDIQDGCMNPRAAPPGYGRDNR